MSKLNLLISLFTFDDIKKTNDPQMVHVDWTRNISNLTVNNPSNKKEVLAPGESITLLNGAVSTSIDGTTQFDLTNTAGSTYRIAYDGTGTAPVFRTERALAADATSAITITKNNNATTTLTASAGTIANFGVAVVGDELRLGAAFNVANQGTHQIIAKSATTVTIKKADSIAEVVILGAAFAADLRVYSAAGVQKGDQVRISGGFSSATHDTYEISDVSPDFIEFVSTEAIPEENDITPDTGLTIFSDAKSLIYIESDKKALVKINGDAGQAIEPRTVGSSVVPGIYLKLGTAFQIEVENTSLEPATIKHITVE